MRGVIVLIEEWRSGAREVTPLFWLPAAAPSGRSFAPFWSENGIHFAHVGLESGMVFEGTTGAYERIYRFNSK